MLSGLNKDKVKDLTKDLNQLLANFQVYYKNLCGLHWNIKGKTFFVLHEKFKELYTDAQEKIDMVAERILTLEGAPLHTFEDYMEESAIPVGKGITKDTEAVQLILDSLQGLLKIERGILDKSGDADDEGTNALMSDFISEQEKTVWMFKSWLG